MPSRLVPTDARSRRPGSVSGSCATPKAEPGRASSVTIDRSGSGELGFRGHCEPPITNPKKGAARPWHRRGRRCSSSLGSSL